MCGGVLYIYKVVFISKAPLFSYQLPCYLPVTVKSLKICHPYVCSSHVNVYESKSVKEKIFCNSLCMKCDIFVCLIFA